MSKFIKDILRDKNSRKYSITKSIAVLLTITFVVLITIGVIWEKPIDLILMGQILIAMLTLTGFKNNFGARPKPVIPPDVPPIVSTTSPTDEGKF